MAGDNSRCFYPQFTAITAEHFKNEITAHGNHYSPGLRPLEFHAGANDNTAATTSLPRKTPVATRAFDVLPPKSLRTSIKEVVMRFRTSFAALLTISIPAAALLAAAPSNVNCPPTNGRNGADRIRDAVSSDTGLLPEWPEDEKGTEACAKGHGPRGGFSSVAIADGRILTWAISPAPAGREPVDKKKKGGASTGEQYVMAFDVATGKNHWRTQIGPSFEQTGYHGSRCTRPSTASEPTRWAPTAISFALKRPPQDPLEQELRQRLRRKMMSGWALQRIAAGRRQ